MRLKGIKDLKHGFLYDRILIASTTTEAKYFQTPLGQSNKTYLDTNMKVAGMLESMTEFWAWYIRIVPALACTIEDAILLLGTAYLDFQIGEAHPLYAPIFLMPGGSGVVGISLAGDTGTTNYGQNGTTNKEGLCKFARPFHISPNQTFNVTIKWPTAPSALSASTYIYVVLEGLIKVPVS